MKYLRSLFAKFLSIACGGQAATRDDAREASSVLETWPALDPKHTDDTLTANSPFLESELRTAKPVETILPVMLFVLCCYRVLCVNK
jgi:hypothetical protein